ncbi:MAG: DNA-binding transcriptional regulator CytR [Lentisphaerae bacterium ADurb.Bin242]|nr:MAG: DNA-binding transcriptional regulator CytR [Lentisphaerae bacterium ADurb.Bin242]
MNKILHKRTHSDIPAANRRASLEGDLRRLILTHGENYDEPVTTEAQLAESYRLSRNTVRKVLQQLTDEGLLNRKTGFGIFVVPPENRPKDKVKLRRILLATRSSKHAQHDYYAQRLISGILDYTFVYRSELEVVYYDQMTAPRMIDRYRNLKFDAVVYDRPEPSAHEMILRTAGAGIPQVTIGRTVENVPALYVDHDDSIRQVVTFLWGIGMREIHFIDVPLPGPLFVRRRNLFVEELARRGVPEPGTHLFRMKPAVPPEVSLEEYILARPEADSFFVSNGIAPEFLKVMEKLGRRIPEDVSLILLDEDVRNPKYRPFTVFREPVKELGFKAAEVLFKSLTNHLPPEKCQYIPGELVIRESCRLPYADSTWKRC